MRNLLVLSLLGVATMAAATGTPYYFTKTADMDYLHKQKKVFDLFAYVEQDVLTDTEYFEIGRNYDIASNIDYYNNKEFVYEFLDYYKNAGFIYKDALFTYYKQEHREELVLLYRLFYSAKDFMTFYKTACWARLYLNNGLFTAAFSSAVYYRNDTKYIRLPAIYEIYPNLFFDSKVIREAYRLKMTRGYGYNTGFGYDAGIKRENTDNAETYYVYSNYTEVCVNPSYEYEYRLNYFTEDVGFNAYYYYFRMAYPFWMDTKDYNLPSTYRGDFYYFIHKQIMSRYYLERFSNGLGGIEDFTWNKMDLPGYYSDINFYNGVSMPKRDWWNAVPYYKYKYAEYIKKLEVRILEAIDSGFFYDEAGKQYSLYTPEGLNYLANLIEGNCDSYNLKYYGAYDALARDILGQNFDCQCKNYYVPSSLQYFSTSLRDPAFYRLYDRILNFFQRYKSHLNRYSKQELEFPGVRFENVEVDKLYTYFDKKEYLINNAVAVDSYKDGKSFYIKAYNYILNYKPFTYKFAVNSDKETKAVFRIFIGPTYEGEKYDDYSYFLNYYQYFFMLDEFEFNLKTGINTFDRRSTDSYFFQNNFFTGDYYYKKIQKAIEGTEPFTYNERQYAFPGNLYLPKGSFDGTRYKLFFFVSPYEEPKNFEVPIFGNYKYYGKSFGYPLDRPMYPWFGKLSNAYFKDVFIYQMKDYSSKYQYPYQRQY